MAKADQEAFNIIIELISKGYTVQMNDTFGYSVIVWPSYKTDITHFHYEGDTLVDALLKCKKELSDK